MGFPRQEYWSDLPFPFPGDLSNPEIEPVSLALEGRFFTTEPSEEPYILDMFQFVSVQFISVTHLCPTLCNPMDCHMPVSLSITNSQSLLKLMSIESVMPPNHLILYCPLPFPPSIFPRIRVFSKESALCLRWPNYWSFSFSISPSNEHSGLISFRMDWLDILADSQGSSPIPQFKSINSSTLSFLYSPTLRPIHEHWKNHSLD